MQIVIDIDEKIYNDIRSKNEHGKIFNAVKNGTPLPKGHRGIVDLKSVQWAFDDAILEEALRTGQVRATHDEIAGILKTVPTIIEADIESEVEAWQI